MATAKLTKLTVDALAPATTDRFYWDSVLKGFGVKVTPAGSKIYLVQYRRGGGRGGQTKRITIGRHASPWTAETARVEAKILLAQVVQGEDPASRKQQVRKSLTLSELCDQYLLHGTGTKKLSTLSTDRGRIARHIKPLLGGRKVTEINQADIKRFLKNVAEGVTSIDAKTKSRGRARVTGVRGTATRTVGLLGAIFTYAIELGVISLSPVRGVKRFADKKNERYLNKEEMERLGRALRTAISDGVNLKAINIIRLLMLTGARRGEIERLRWAEVDIVGCRLYLADSKTGQKQVPIGSAAVQVLRQVREAGEQSEWVFRASIGPGHYVGTPRVWAKLRSKIDLGDVRLHDLRHSFASVGVESGASLMIVGRLLGHSDHSTTMRYAHLAHDPVALAADRISNLMETAMGFTSQR